MKKLFIALAVCLVAAPAFARPATTAVGPYAVETRVTEMGGTLTVRGTVSGGGDCDRMLISVQLADSRSGQAAAINADLDRYRGHRGRFDGDARVGNAGLTDWYIHDITIQCINKGVATRYSANP